MGQFMHSFNGMSANAFSPLGLHGAPGLPPLPHAPPSFGSYPPPPGHCPPPGPPPPGYAGGHAAEPPGPPEATATWSNPPPWPPTAEDTAALLERLRRELQMAEETTKAAAQEGGAFVGVVSRLSLQQGCGAIECAEAAEKHGTKDILVPRQHLCDLHLGDTVVFMAVAAPSGEACVTFAKRVAELSQQRQRILDMEAPLPAVGAQESAQEYIGFVTSFQAERGFGFVGCSQTKQIYGTDVYIHKEQFVELEVGVAVYFRVALNPKGMPVARGLRKTLARPLGAGTSGSAPPRATVAEPPPPPPPPAPPAPAPALALAADVAAAEDDFCGAAPPPPPAAEAREASKGKPRARDKSRSRSSVKSPASRSRSRKRKRSSSSCSRSRRKPRSKSRSRRRTQSKSKRKSRSRDKLSKSKRGKRKRSSSS